MSPTRDTFPWCYVFQGFSLQIFKTCFPLQSQRVRKNWPLLLKFVWRYYTNGLGAFCFFAKKRQNSFGTTILMVWEPPRVTTTTADDGKTAAVLTFFFYRQVLSHVSSDINISAGVSQETFSRFFKLSYCFFTRLEPYCYFW